MPEYHVGRGVCGECIYWRDDQWIMNKYGEGCGICKQSGQVTFCSHPCPLCVKRDG